MKGILGNKLFYLKIFVAILLTFYLIKLIGAKDLYRTFLLADKRYFLFSCCLIPLFVFIKSVKWHMLVSRAGALESFSTSVCSILIGLGLGMFTPGRVGEVGRIISYSSVDRVMLGGLVVIDRVIDLITVVYLGMYFIGSQISWWLALIVFVLNSFLLVSLKLLVKANRLVPIAYRRNRVYSLLDKISECSRALRRKDLGYYLGLSLFNWLVAVLQYQWIVNGYYFCPFKVALGSFPMLQLCNLLPISVAGIGVREGISIVVMKLYNVPEGVAVISAFSLFLIDAVIPGFIGVLILNMKVNRRVG